MPNFQADNLREPRPKMVQNASLAPVSTIRDIAKTELKKKESSPRFKGFCNKEDFDEKSAACYFSGSLNEFPCMNKDKYSTPKQMQPSFLTHVGSEFLDMWSDRE